MELLAQGAVGAHSRAVYAPEEGARCPHLHQPRPRERLPGQVEALSSSGRQQHKQQQQAAAGSSEARVKVSPKTRQLASKQADKQASLFCRHGLLSVLRLFATRQRRYTSILYIIPISNEQQPKTTNCHTIPGSASIARSSTVIARPCQLAARTPWWACSSTSLPPAERHEQLGRVERKATAITGRGSLAGQLFICAAASQRSG